MSSSALAAGLVHLRGKLAVQLHKEESDEHLLQAFTTHQDDSAFAVLVRRHGPMVLHVCRRLLGHEQDAEDAFQAVFLVLARNADSLRNQASLVSFLHGTAYRIAMKAKQTAARRRKHEKQAPPPKAVDPTDELSWREVRELLDEEIDRLPDMYRSVFVLCHLENVSRDEAAQRLGLKERTVLSRLAEARKRLSKRLARRGIELTSALAVTALTTPPASSLPARLLVKTMKAVLAAAAGKDLAKVVSVSVVELVNGAATLIGGKAKIATLLLVTASLLGGAGVYLMASPQRPGERRGVSPPVAANTGGLTPRRSPETAKGDELHGRVLDPDGQPVKDARLHWPHFQKDAPRSFDSLEMLERGRSDGEGRFRIALPAGEDLDNSVRQLIVTAPGYGLTWVDVPKTKAAEDLTVRLRKDVTIRGRILSTEGRPLAGVRVAVERLEEMPNGRLDEYLAFWEQDWSKTLTLKTRWLQFPFKQAIMPHTVTDRDGSFQLSGVGSERIVHLKIRGEGIAHALLPLVARPGFDPSAVNKAVLNRRMMGLVQPGIPPVLYGPSFTYVAVPARIVEGIVREAGTGKPVPGIRVFGNAGYRSDSEAITDKEGRYRLEGLPKVKRYLHLSAFPSLDSPWLSAAIENKDASDGLQSVQVDFTLGRGVVLKGRVIDKSTGKGVACSIMYDLLSDNKYVGKPGYEPPHHSYASNADGRFRIKLIPGTGVLKVYAGGAVNPFLSAQFSAEDRKHITMTADGDFTTFGGGVGFLKMVNAVKRLDLAPDAGVVEQDLYLERGATAKVRIQDPQGKPLSGALVSGIDAIPGGHHQNAYVSPDSECVILALDPRQPRQVIFYHGERRLAGSLIVRGDEKEPLTVRLAPTGTLTGRVQDADGRPVSGVDIEIWGNDPSSATSLTYLYLHLNSTRLPVRTDKEGRFRMQGVVPGEKFSVNVRRRGAYLDIGSRTRQLQVKAGETLDLDNLTIKAMD